MSEPVWRRLNPLTMVVEFARVVGRMVYVLVIVVLSPGARGDFVYEAIGLIVVGAAVARYVTYRYAVHEGNLVIKSGVITRTTRTIPLSKIQNINASKNLVHRIFGLVDLKIETAAGRESEASISALSEKDAEALKRELTAGVAREIGAAEGAPPVKGRTVYRINTRELLLAGATENRTLAIIATFFGGSFAFQQRLEDLAKRVLPDLHGSWVPIAVFAFFVFLVGWVISIFSAILNYANFELTLEDGKLRRHFGLINQIESVVPLPRVQVVRSSETLFQRMLHICKLYVETAGSYDKQDLHGSSLVSPLLEHPRLPDIVQTILPGRHIFPLRWSSVSRKTIRTHFQRAMLGYAVLVSLASLYFGPKAFWALLPLAAWSLFTGWVSYRTMGYQDGPNVLATRHGVFSRRTLYVPTEKIQCVSVKESPLQRRLGLASLVAHTAATGHSGSGFMFDLPADVAGSLSGTLHRRSVESVRMTGEVL